MLSNFRKSVTLIELLIAITLLSVIILAINNVSVFSRYHFVSTDRRAKIQNDASRCLEHITKYASQAIGNEAVFGTNTAIYTGTNVLTFFMDANANGLRESSQDYWVGYRLNSSTYQLEYCNRCSNLTCSACAGTTEYLANDITAFSSTKDFSQGNYVNANITACWDPAQSHALCNTPDNPSVTMNTTINLPSVSTH